MTSNLWKIECEPDCGFLIRSHDESEVVTAGLSHVNKVHKMNTTAQEIKGKIERA